MLLGATSLPGKSLFTVSSSSSKSKIVRTSSTTRAPFRPIDWYDPLAGERSSLSDLASRAYRATTDTIADGAHYVENTRAGRYVGTMVDEARDSVNAVVSYLYNPTPMSASVMQQFGFSPVSNHDECPLLQTPTPQQVGALSTLVKGVGDIFTGTVNLRKYGDGSRHFYIVAARCGNVNTIARAAGVTPAAVRSRLGSMLGMVATWAGCMMAGGATIEPTPDALRELDSMDAGGQAPRQPVFGKGILTEGEDMVELRNATRSSAGGATLHSFLARTLYFHALSGSVLHMQYIADGGDITWFWVGAGGKGFMSKRVNNILAIQLDIGIWPDMARSITSFYSDPDMVKKFVQAPPQSIKTLIRNLISSTEEKKGFFKDQLQRMQVTAPPAEIERGVGKLRNWGNGVKGQ